MSPTRYAQHLPVRCILHQIITNLTERAAGIFQWLASDRLLEGKEGKETCPLSLSN